jgi:tetratricopeptide (TPR) repeat protein
VDNILAVYQWALDRGEMEVGLRLYQPTAEWLGYSGWMATVWPRWYQAVVAQQDTLAPAVRAKALSFLGRRAWRQHDYERASALLAEGLALCATQGDQAGRAEALWYLADVRRDQGAYEPAGRLYEESLELYQALGDQHHTAWVYHSRGELALLQGDAARALALEQASLELFRAGGQTSGIGLALLNQGFAALQQGDTAQAVRRFQEAVSQGDAQESPCAKGRRRWSDNESPFGRASALILGIMPALAEPEAEKVLCLRDRMTDRQAAPACVFSEAV